MIFSHFSTFGLFERLNDLMHTDGSKKQESSTREFLLTRTGNRRRLETVAESLVARPPSRSL